MKNILLFCAILMTVIFMSCSPNFDNPLDPTNSQAPSLFINYLNPIDNTLMDIRNIVVAERDELVLCYGMEDDLDIDVTIEATIDYKNVGIDSFHKIFETCDTVLVDTLKYLPISDGDYNIKIFATDSNGNSIVDSFLYVVDKNGLKDVQVSAVAKNDTISDVEIVFDSFAGVDFSFLNAFSDVDTLYMKFKNLSETVEGDSIEYLNVKDFNPEIDSLNNIVVLKNVPITNSRENNFALIYKVNDRLGRNYENFDGVTVDYEFEQLLEVELISNSNYFNKRNPIKIKFNKPVEVDEIGITTTLVDDTPVDLQPVRLTSFIYEVTSYDTLAENESYNIKIKRDEELINNFDVIYNTEAPTIDSCNIEENEYEQTVIYTLEFSTTVTEVKFIVDNEIIFYEPNSAEFQFEYFFEDDGLYLFEFEFIDEVGNFGVDSYYINFLKGPVVEQITPTKGSWLNSDKIVKIITDEILLPDSCFATINGDNVTIECENDSLWFSTDFDDEGHYDFMVHLVSENLAFTEDEWSYEYDSIEPSVVISPSNDSQFSEPSVDIEFSFNENISHYKIRKMGVIVDEDNNLDNDFLIYNAVLDSIGKIDFSIDFYDLAGNGVTRNWAYVFSPEKLIITIRPYIGNAIEQGVEQEITITANYQLNADECIVTQDGNPQDIQVNDNVISFLYTFDTEGDINFSCIVEDIYGRTIEEDWNYQCIAPPKRQAFLKK